MVLREKLGDAVTRKTRYGLRPDRSKCHELTPKRLIPKVRRTDIDRESLATSATMNRNPVVLTVEVIDFLDVFDDFREIDF